MDKLKIKIAGWFCGVFCGILSLFVFVLSCIWFHYASKKYDQPIPCKIEVNYDVSHRGWIGDYQENTMGAVIDSYVNGYIPEIDVVLSADNELFLYHGGTPTMYNGSFNDDLAQLNLNEALQYQYPKILNSYEYKASSPVITFKRLLDGICNSSVIDITSLPYIWLDLKHLTGLSDIMFSLNERDAILNDKIYNELKKSLCYRNNITLNVVVQSYSYRGLSDTMDKYKSDQYLKFSYSYFFPFGGISYPFGPYFWIKNRLWVYFLSKRPTYFLIPYNAYIKLGSVMSNYKTINKICPGYYQDAYDTDLSISSDVESNFGILNINQTAWISMATYKNEDTSVKIGGKLVHGFICTYVAFCWILLIFLCYVLFYGILYKKWDVCCCKNSKDSVTETSMEMGRQTKSLSDA